jgi:hypothetical protein
MRSHRFLLLASVAVLLVLGPGAAPERKLVERWTNPDHEPRHYQKLLVVAITPNTEVRKNFENLFVSHLRGKGIEAVTSHSMVPDLGAVDAADLQEILRLIDERRIDGAISVRAVPLAKKESATQWADDWAGQVRSSELLRELVEKTLTAAGQKAKSYGLEVALWNAEDGRRVWGGRTDPYTVGEMRKGAAEFAQFVMHGLDLDGMIR